MLVFLFGIILVAGAAETDFQQSSATRTDSTRQGTDSVVNKILHVDRVLIIGNKVTRNRIITRELSLKPGDTVSTKVLPGILQWDKNKLYKHLIFRGY